MFNDRKLPKDITIKNTGNEPISFRFYGVNIVKTLEPDEEIVITGASSEVTGFYLAQMDDVKGLSVEATDSDNPEPHPQPQPGVTHTVSISFFDNDTDEPINCDPTVDDESGELVNVGVYEWYDVEEGIHTLRVDYVGYDMLQDDINVLDDINIGYYLVKDEEPEKCTVSFYISDSYDGSKFIPDTLELRNQETGTTLTLADADEIDEKTDIITFIDINTGRYDLSISSAGFISYNTTLEFNSNCEYGFGLDRQSEDTYEITAKFTADDTGEDLICNPTLEGAEGELDDNNVYHWRDLSNGDYDLRVAEDGAFGYWGLYANITVNNADVHVEYTLESKNAEPETFNLRVRGISSADDTDVIMSSGVLINEDTGDEIEYSHSDGNDLIFEDMTVGNYWGRFEAYGYKNFDSSVGILDGSNDLSLSFEPRVEEIALIENNLYALANTINIYDGDDNPVTVERDPRGVMFYVARLNDGETYHIVATKEGYENIDEFFTIDYSGTVRHNFNWVKAPVIPTTFQVALSFDGDDTTLELDDVTLDGAQPDDVTSKGEQYVYMWNNVENGDHLLYAMKSGYHEVEETITVNGTNYSETINMEKEPDEPDDLVEVMLYGVDSNGNDMWNGNSSGYQLSAGETLDDETIADIERNHIVDGYHIDGYFSDMECTQEFNFDEPIMENTDMYILYAQDETEPMFCTVKVGFNAEDDGVDDYVLVDDAKLEVTSVVSGDVPDEVFIPTVDENNMYVFENVPEGSYQISGTKSGYARFDESRDSTGQIVNGVYTTEITLYKNVSFNVEFKDNEDNSVQVDNISLVDENEREATTITIKYYTTNDVEGYYYEPENSVPVGTYYIIASKTGYQPIREQVTLDGWEYVTISLIPENE